MSKIQVIIVKEVGRGQGSVTSPRRIITEYRDTTGKLIAVHDPEDLPIELTQEQQDNYDLNHLTRIQCIQLEAITISLESEKRILEDMIFRLVLERDCKELEDIATVKKAKELIDWDR